MGYNFDQNDRVAMDIKKPSKKIVKRFITMISLLLVLFAAGIYLFAYFVKVPSGYVGILVNTTGGGKGVQEKEIPVGRYLLYPTQELFLFPTFTQTVEWTKESNIISFQTNEGLRVSAPIGIIYSIDPNKAAKLYQTYRKGINEITNVFIYNIVRDAFNDKSSYMKVEDVYGSGKRTMLKEIEDKLRDELAVTGIRLERVFFAGDPKLPQQVTEALNAKIKATQMAEQRKNEVAQSKAEAEKLREQAKGESDAVLIRAKAEAEAIRIRSESLQNNIYVLILTAIEKWDGELPRFWGGQDLGVLFNSLDLGIEKLPTKEK